MRFVQAAGAGLRLCQQFVCHNPARLPPPAQWVTVNRHRVIDSFTHVWWMARGARVASRAGQVGRRLIAWAATPAAARCGSVVLRQSLPDCVDGAVTVGEECPHLVPRQDRRRGR